MLHLALDRAVKERLILRNSAEDSEGCRITPHPFPRSSSHVRDRCSAERRGRENGVQHARPLRRGLYPAHLHARHSSDAGERGGEDGTIYGTGTVSTRKITGEKGRPFLSGDFIFSPWVKIYVAILRLNF